MLLFIAAAGATYKAALAMGKKWSELKFRGYFEPANLPRRFVNGIRLPVNDTYCNAGFFQLACKVSNISSNVNHLREMEGKKARGDLRTHFITIPTLLLVRQRT